jgi:hypothetical protein
MALRREVMVLEVPAAAFARPGTLGRLRREAWVLAATSVGSVVRILDIDTRGDPVRVVTEHVPGPTLADFLDVGPFAPAPAIRLLDDVAAALQMMGWHALVHGGVDAERVVVLPNGRARLRGFGIDRAVRATEPDQWSDAYDFAELAHRVLTGSAPALTPDDGMPPLPWRAAEVLFTGLAEPAKARPLPHQLVQTLRSIPAEDWSIAPPAAPAVPAPVIAPPVPPDPAPEPTFDWEPDPDEPRWSRPPWWLRWATSFLGLASIVAAGIVGTQLLDPWRLTGDGIEVRGVQVAAQPGPLAQCPRARLVFVATIATNGRPGDLTISWTRPDGSEPPPEHVRVSEGQRTVRSTVAFTFRGRSGWSGRAFVRVAGDDGGWARQTVEYVCDDA